MRLAAVFLLGIPRRYADALKCHPELVARHGLALCVEPWPRSLVADRSKPGSIIVATNQEYRQDEENRDGKGFPV